jgi:hypothetical protein
MHDRTEPPAPQEPARYCTWCRAWATDTEAVRVVEQASGPGWIQSACAACRARRGLKPISEQTLDELAGRR